MLAEEAKACFSPWSTCWLHSSLEFEKSHNRNTRLVFSGTMLAQLFNNYIDQPAL